MAWTSPRTWVAGEKPTAATLNTHIRDQFKAIGDAWTAFTPTWTAVTTNPTIGNGTLNGYYMAAGKLIMIRYELTIGSTTTVGSGAYRWSLPFAGTLNLAWLPYGVGIIRDTSAAATAVRTVTTVNNATIMLVDTAGVQASGATPFALADTDTIYLTATYEAD